MDAPLGTPIEPTPMEFEDWVERFRPIPNDLDEHASLDGLMFETYGAEVDRVQNSDVHHVWTVIALDTDDEFDGTWVIAAGFHRVNRLGYLLTERPWQDDEEFIEVYY